MTIIVLRSADNLYGLLCVYNIRMRIVETLLCQYMRYNAIYSEPATRDRQNGVPETNPMAGGQGGGDKYLSRKSIKDEKYYIIVEIAEVYIYIENTQKQGTEKSQIITIYILYTDTIYYYYTNYYEWTAAADVVTKREKPAGNRFHQPPRSDRPAGGDPHNVSSILEDLDTTTTTTVHNGRNMCVYMYYITYGVIIIRTRYNI